jgi:hypothetical protein
LIRTSTSPDYVVSVAGFGAELVEQIAAARDQGEPGAGPGQLAGDGFSDSGRGAGHEGVHDPRAYYIARSLNSEFLL